MIELRWIVTGDRKRLQYRQKVERYSEHGHWFEWGAWKEVEHFVESPLDRLKKNE